MDSDDAHDRSAGAPPAVAGATRPRYGEVTIRDRGRLPHWEQDDATYFVTFRLADSFPKSVLDRIESERQSDHLLRSETEFKRAVRYVVENPAKANLKPWQWVWVRGRGAPATAGEGAGATVE